MWKEGEGWEGGSRIKYGTIKREKRKEGWRVRKEEGESMGRSREKRERKNGGLGRRE